MKKGLHKPMIWGSAFVCFLILPCIVYGASSNCVVIPNLRFEKTVGLGDECGTKHYIVVEPGTVVTYCLTLENSEFGGTQWKWFIVSDPESGLTWAELDSQSDAIPEVGEQVQYTWQETISGTGTNCNTANVSIGTYEEDEFGDECVVTEEDRACIHSREEPEGGPGPSDQVPGMTEWGLAVGGVLLIVAGILFIRRRQTRKL